MKGIRVQTDAPTCSLARSKCWTETFCPPPLLLAILLLVSNAAVFTKAAKSAAKHPTHSSANLCKVFELSSLEST